VIYVPRVADVLRGEFRLDLKGGAPAAEGGMGPMTAPDE
jgi:hypothetical protein